MLKFPRKPVPCLTDIEQNSFPNGSNDLDLKIEHQPHKSAFPYTATIQEHIVTPVSPPPSPPIFGKHIPMFHDGYCTPEVTDITNFEGPPPAPKPSTRLFFNTVDLPNSQNEDEETCSICLDPKMFVYDALPLECGHYVHRYCLRTATAALDGAKPLCAGCGSDCVPLKTDMLTPPLDDSYVSSDEESSYEEPSILPAPPLNVKTTHWETPHSPTGSVKKYEYLFEIESYSINKSSSYKYIPTAKDEELARTMAMDVLTLIEQAGFSMRLSMLGRLRLFSIFSYQSIEATCYLFDSFIVITTNDAVRQIVDLGNNELYIYPTSNSISFTCSSDHVELFSTPDVISKWMAAIITRSWKFPLVEDFSNGELMPPFDFPHHETLTIEIVVCLPFDLLQEVVPTILSQLGPQDRLGLIIMIKTQDSNLRYAYLRPCKPSWNGWKYFNDITMNSCQILTDCESGGLDFVSTFFTPHNSIQQSIIVLPGYFCSNYNSYPPLHIISNGDLTMNIDSSSSIPNTGHFLYANSRFEIKECVRGLVSTLRTYVHVDPVLTLSTTDSNSQQLRIPLGTLVSGQIKSLIVESDTPFLNAHIESHGSRNICLDLQHNYHIHPYKVEFYKVIRTAQKTISKAGELVENNFALAISELTHAAQNMLLDVSARMSISDLDLSMAKSQHLANGLLEIKDKLIKAETTGVMKAILKESEMILANQLAVTSRTSIEKIFFEALDANVI